VLAMPSIMPRGIPRRVGYVAARHTVPSGILCRTGYYVARDITSRGILCCTRYHVAQSAMPFERPCHRPCCAAPT
jgi:hypothetical protein